MIRSTLLLLASASSGALLAQTPACAPFPAGFIPFASVYNVFGIPGNNQLVAGMPGSGGYRDITIRLPLPAAPDQMFCGSIELAPGRFFDGVYVPTPQERVGDYSKSTDVAGRVITLYDPAANLPFPGNIVPASRLDGFFAFRVRGSLTSITPSGCAPFPTGFIPFASVYNVFGIPGNNQLVAGMPGSGGYPDITIRLPLPGAPDQMFCGNSIELAPGRFFDGVYVPTPQERVGDYSKSTDVAGRVITLYDPAANLPFPGNIVPASRLDGFFAFRVRASLASIMAPAIAAGGIGSATGDLGVAPGGLISIFGTNLASAVRAASAVAPATYLYTVLEDAQVRIGGSYAPLLYVSPGQINAQMPFEVAPGTQTVVVTRAGLSSTSFSLTVSPVAPAIFDGAFLKNSDYSLVSAQNPARAGDVLLIYCTGLGAVAPAVATGRLAPSSPVSAPVSTPRVTIGGLDAQVIYAILSPGFLGLYQIAVFTPDGLQSGPAAVVITSGGAISAPKNVVIGAR